MKALILAVALFTTVTPGDVVCRIGTAWQGSLADLALIEAVHQRTEAAAAGQPFPNGAPEQSPWTGLVHCTRG